VTYFDRLVAFQQKAKDSIGDVLIVEGACHLKGNIMLRDDAIRAGLIKPTKEDRERMGMEPIKPGPKPKEEKETPKTDNK
jgi:hypothetical protein